MLCQTINSLCIWSKLNTFILPLPHKFSGQFPFIPLAGWRELLWGKIVMPNNTKQYLGHCLNLDRSILTPLHYYVECMQSILQCVLMISWTKAPDVHSGLQPVTVIKVACTISLCKVPVTPAVVTVTVNKKKKIIIWFIFPSQPRACHMTYN